MNGAPTNDKGDLLKTGIPGLDDVLCGGIAPGSCVLVEGVPGAGKTTLGLQFIYAGETQFDHPGMVVTFEEFPEEIYRDAMSYGWDLRSVQPKDSPRVLGTSPEALHEDTMDVDGLFDRLIGEIEPRRILVDSISQMAYVDTDQMQLRRVIYGLRNWFRRHGLTAVLTKEVQSETGSDIPFEEYVADVVIRLGYRLVSSTGHRVRELEVTKSRARPHLSGRHLIQITSDGMAVTPSTISLPTEPQIPPELSFVSTGSESLDGMLGGGLIRGSTNITAGSTGVGKTVLGLQFLCAGAENGEKGLLVSFEQTQDELVRMAASLGLPHQHMTGDGPITIIQHKPDLNPLGFIIARIANAVDDLQPQRLVIDAVSTLAKRPGEEAKFRSDLANLVAVIRFSPATSLLCDETPGIVGEFEVTGGVAVSSQMDSIIILRYVELSSEMRRAVSVLKARCVDHDKQIREYSIQRGGLQLRDKFNVGTGLMRGTPQQRDVDDFF